MSKDTSCKICSFYEDHVVNAGSAPVEAGLCRFNPPVTQPTADARGLWPVVSATDWCGQFEDEAKAA